MTTAASSTPFLIIDGFGDNCPKIWAASTTMVSSAVADTARWVGYGVGSTAQPSNILTGRQINMRVGDVLMHIGSTGAANPGRVSLHSVLSSTVGSSAYNASYDVTVSLST